MEYSRFLLDPPPCVPSCDERKLALVHLLVGTDGSHTAVRAAQQGMTLLTRPDRLTLLTVVTNVPIPPDEDSEEFFSSPDDQERQWQDQIAEVEASLERTAAALPGVRVDRRIEGGDAARTICDVARELGVDAIVVGAHARGRLGRLVLGSVSEHVVRHAPCPVLVVHANGSSLTSSS